MSDASGITATLVTPFELPDTINLFDEEEFRRWLFPNQLADNNSLRLSGYSRNGWLEGALVEIVEALQLKHLDFLIGRSHTFRIAPHDGSDDCRELLISILRDADLTIVHAELQSILDMSPSIASQLAETLFLETSDEVMQEIEMASPSKSLNNVNEGEEAEYLFSCVKMLQAMLEYAMKNNLWIEYELDRPIEDWKFYVGRDLKKYMYDLAEGASSNSFAYKIEPDLSNAKEKLHKALYIVATEFKSNYSDLFLNFGVLAKDCKVRFDALYSKSSPLQSAKTPFFLELKYISNTNVNSDTVNEFVNRILLKNKNLIAPYKYVLALVSELDQASTETVRQRWITALSSKDIDCEVIVYFADISDPGQMVILDSKRSLIGSQPLRETPFLASASRPLKDTQNTPSVTLPSLNETEKETKSTKNIIGQIGGVTHHFLNLCYAGLKNLRFEVRKIIAREVYYCVEVSLMIEIQGKLAIMLYLLFTQTGA